ncbi:MAG: transposase [Planctomycetaceae bacterium]|nr:transposase [Planctomycetaceae bacterium]
MPGDSGFCREQIMKSCEAHGVHYLLGLARNSRLTAEIAAELETVKAECDRTGQAARVFKDCAYRSERQETGWGLHPLEPTRLFTGH